MFLNFFPHHNAIFNTLDYRKYLSNEIYLFDRMTEKRFQRLEEGKTCFNNKQEDVKSLGECKEAAHQLGYSFRGQRNWTTTNTVTISQACFAYDNIILWVQYQVGELDDGQLHAICRKTGKSILQCCIALYQIILIQSFP